MINVNQITAQLAKMPDQMLQKYAAMHKNDPYTVALALAESNRRKQIRTSAQAQAAGQEMPKVVDQEVAQMAAPQALPEDVGIAKLPAQNIQNMAGGGIVAFEEGGEVPRYNGVTDGSQVSTSPFGEMLRGIGGWFSQAGNPATNPRAQLSALQADKARAEQGFFEALTPAQKAQRQAQVQQIDSKIKDLQAQMGKPAAPAPTTQAPATMPSEGFTRPAMANDPRLVGNAASAAPAVDTSAKAAPTEKQTGLGAIAPKQEAASTGIDAIIKGIKANLPPSDDKMADREGFLSERDEIRKPVYEKMAKMIDDEKGKLKGDREQAFYMALIEGGLAAAGASGPNGIQNLAQGFSKGAASFGGALKDIRKAAKENAKMEIEAERMQAADKINDRDAYQRSADAYLERQAKRDAAITAGVFSITGDKMRADAQIKAAGIAASAPSAQERLFMALGGGDINKGLERFQAAQADKTGASYAKLYADYAANADKAGADKMSPMEFAQNIQLFMGSLQGGGFQKKPTGDIYKLPGT